MESDAEGRRRLIRVYECSDTVEQRMVPRGSNNKRLTNANSIATTSFMSTGQPLFVAASDSCTHIMVNL